jgi:Cys-tRNA(Pro)/Cys-tRNA(Cys) deacylase
VKATATPAIDALVRAGLDHRIHKVGHDPRVTAFGREAAEALGVEAGRVFKTLVCAGPAGLAVAVVPVTGELDLKALAAALGEKVVSLADAAAAQRSSGYVLGGISPIGQKRPLPTVIDETAERWDTIFVSAGRRGLELELAPGDLLGVTGGRFAAIAKAR